MPSLVRAVLLVAVIGCSGGSKGPNNSDGGGGGGGTTAQPPSASDKRCAAIRDRVRSLYASAAGTASDPDPAKRALAADQLEADVDVVLADCHDQPDRVIACVGKVQTADELSSTCLIPLDEDGHVEGGKFGKTR